MATSRATGTGEVIETYGGAGQGRDYTAFNSWESATDVDNVTANESPVLECYADQANFNDRINMVGATNDATRFRIVRPATGEFHDGTTNNGVGSGVYFRYVHATNHNQVGNSSSDTHSQLQDISMTLLSDSTTGGENTLRLRGNDTKAIGVLIFDSFNSGTGTCIGFRPTTGTGIVVANCLGVNCDSDNFQNFASGSVAYNCTSIDSNGDAYDDNAGAWTLKNCLGDGSTNTDFSGAGLTMTNCASGDNSASGTGARINQTFTFVDAANGDYHLSDSDAGAKGFGTDLSSDATFAFDDDVDRETVSTWSIGFDTLVAAAATAVRTLAILGVGV